MVEGAHLQSDGFKQLDNGGNTGFDKNEVLAKARYHTDPGAAFYHQWDARWGYATEVSNETYLGLTDDDFSQTPTAVTCQASRAGWIGTACKCVWVIIWPMKKRLTYKSPVTVMILPVIGVS